MAECLPRSVLVLGSILVSALVLLVLLLKGIELFVKRGLQRFTGDAGFDLVDGEESQPCMISLRKLGGRFAVAPTFLLGLDGPRRNQQCQGDRCRFHKALLLFLDPSPTAGSLPYRKGAIRSSTDRRGAPPASRTADSGKLRSS